MKIALAMMYYRGVFPTVSDPVIPGMVVSTNFEANARTHFLIVTLSHTLELNASGLGEKRMEPLSRYFVPLHIRPGESAKGTLSRMIANAAPYIVHQDLYSINETLQVCGALFKRVMRWKNSEPQRLLKEQMAGMIWLLAHNHRDERGTASETEWLERAIYKAHGFAVRALTTRMIDCVALATPLLSAFVPLYIDSLELEPLPAGGLPEEAALSQVPATCLATEAASPSVVGAPVSTPPLVAAGEKEPKQ
jgi:hypothetical protein